MRVKMVFQGKDIYGLKMTNQQLIDPFHPITRAIKDLMDQNKGKAKTEARQWEIYRLQFFGSLYIMDGIGPYLKTSSLTACLIDAAKITRMGTKLAQAVTPAEPWAPLLYKGPRTKEELWDDGGFHEIAPAGKGGMKIMLCKPHFRPWAVEFELELDTVMLGLATLKDTAEAAGRYIGLGAGRKMGFGRFTATVEALEPDNSGGRRKKAKLEEVEA